MIIPETLSGQCGFFLLLGFVSGLVIAGVMQVWNIIVSSVKSGVGSFEA